MPTRKTMSDEEYIPKRFCSKCGQELQKDNDFCPSCMDNFSDEPEPPKHSEPSKQSNQEYEIIKEAVEIVASLVLLYLVLNWMWSATGLEDYYCRYEVNEYDAKIQPIKTKYENMRCNRNHVSDALYARCVEINAELTPMIHKRNNLSCVK